MTHLALVMAVVLRMAAPADAGANAERMILEQLIEDVLHNGDVYNTPPEKFVRPMEAARRAQAALNAVERQRAVR